MTVEHTSDLADVLAKLAFDGQDTNTGLLVCALAETVAIKMVETAYSGAIIPILKCSLVTNGSRATFDIQEYRERQAANNIISWHYCDKNEPLDYHKDLVAIALRVMGRCGVTSDHTKVKKKDDLIQIRLNLSNIQVMAEYIRAVRQMLLVKSKDKTANFWECFKDCNEAREVLFHNRYDIPKDMRHSVEFHELYLEDQLYLSGCLLMNSLEQLMLSKNALNHWLELDTTNSSSTSIAIGIHLYKPK